MSAGTILGIDGGGSKTLLAVADNTGNVTRMVFGGGTNPMDNPNWRADLNTLFSELGPLPPDLVGAAAGLPAYGEVAAISAAQRAAISELLGPTPRRILNDVDAAHFGAFAGQQGILILSGSGSMAWARDRHGASFRVGGWGDGFGDEGSAHWIGMRTIALVSQGLDGRAEVPALVDAFFDFLHLDRTEPNDSLGAWFAGLGHARSEIAALAELIDRLAQAGEPAALAILDDAARELALHVRAIARRVEGGDQLAWSYAGGAFKSRLLLENLIGKIGRLPRPPILPPIGGALLCAALDLDWLVDEAWIGRLAASIEGHAATRGAAANLNPTTVKPNTVKQGEQGHA
jgi:N-acetylglucosamine kinase-like BadF-type ATPase